MPLKRNYYRGGGRQFQPTCGNGGVLDPDGMVRTPGRRKTGAPAKTDNRPERRKAWQQRLW
jgi:hypothetical protein